MQIYFGDHEMTLDRWREIAEAMYPGHILDEDALVRSGMLEPRELEQYRESKAQNERLSFPPELNNDGDAAV